MHDTAFIHIRREHEHITELRQTIKVCLERLRARIDIMLMDPTAKLQIIGKLENSTTDVLINVVNEQDEEKWT